MTIEEFNLLGHTEQDELVSNDGIFIVNYDHGDEMCDVYELFDFFVNFCYDLSRNEQPRITAFLDIEGFQPFKLLMP